MYSATTSARKQPLGAHLCFPLLSELISAIEEEPKETVLHWQNKCKNALLLFLVKEPLRSVRHLASLAMEKIFEKGGSTPTQSRGRSLQGLQAESKRSGTLPCAREAITPRRRWPTSGMAGSQQQPEVGGQDKCGGRPKSNADPNMMIGTKR